MYNTSIKSTNQASNVCIPFLILDIECSPFLILNIENVKNNKIVFLQVLTYLNKKVDNKGEFSGFQMPGQNKLDARLHFFETQHTSSIMA